MEVIQLDLNATSAAESSLDPDGVVQELMVVIGSSLSLVFIAFAFITFTLFSDLKDLTGFVMINLFSAVFMGQLFLLIGIDRARSNELCHFFAISLHFIWLATFFWISAGIYDISQDVRTRLAPTIQDGSKILRNHVLCYSAYGWGGPFIIVVLCVLVHLEMNGLFESPGHRFAYLDADRVHCWMIDRDGVIIGLGLPFLWLIASTAFSFQKGWQILNRTMLLSYKVGLKTKEKRPEYIVLKLYLKIILIFSATWILGFTAVLSGSELVWILFITALSLSGCFVALLFTCNSAVFTVYASKKKENRENVSYGAPSEISFETTFSLMAVREHEPERLNV